MPTGVPEIDSEYSLLVGSIARVRDICPASGDTDDCARCSREVALCRQNLIDTLGDLLTFLVDHFFAEEQAMKKLGLTESARDLCDRHKEGHALISDAMLEIVAAVDSAHITVLARRLCTLLDGWLENHAAWHEGPLAGLTRQR